MGMYVVGYNIDIYMFISMKCDAVIFVNNMNLTIKKYSYLPFRPELKPDIVRITEPDPNSV